MSPELSSSLLISPQLIPALLGFSQVFSTHLSFPQLMSAHCMCFHLFSHLLNSSHISSGDLSCCQFVSPHFSSSQRSFKNNVSYFLAHKRAPKIDLSAKASHPDAFHREAWTQRNFDTQHAFAHKNLYTKTSAQKQGSFFSQRVFAQKLLHRANFYTQKLLHRGLLHRETFAQRAFTHRNFYTENPLTQRNLCTYKLFHRDSKTFTRRKGHFYLQKTFTQSKLLHTANFYTEKLLHRETFTEEICT